MERADNGARTRNIDLGRVALYQLSYIRMWAEAPSKKDCSTSLQPCQALTPNGVVPVEGVHQKIRLQARNAVNLAFALHVVNGSGQVSPVPQQLSVLNSRKLMNIDGLVGLLKPLIECLPHSNTRRTAGLREDSNSHSGINHRDHQADRPDRRRRQKRCPDRPRRRPRRPRRRQPQRERQGRNAAPRSPVPGTCSSWS